MASLFPQAQNIASDDSQRGIGSPDEIRRRLILQQLQEGTSAAPIQHWTQGLARLSSALMGGYDLGELERKSQAEQSDAQRLMAEQLQQIKGPAGAPPQMPMSSAPQVMAGPTWLGDTAQVRDASPQVANVWPALPSAPTNLAQSIIGVESGNNPLAKNPRSTATGAGQFIDSTWMDVLGRNRPDLTAGKTPDQILALRNDPTISAEMTDHYARENGQKLSSAGLPVTPGTQYLAHFAGPEGATKVLSANPATPVAQILGSSVVAANPFLANMTAGDLTAWANRKMGAAPATATAQATSPVASDASALALQPGNAAPPGLPPMPQASPPGAGIPNSIAQMLGGVPQLGATAAPQAPVPMAMQPTAPQAPMAARQPGPSLGYDQAQVASLEKMLRNPKTAAYAQSEIAKLMEQRRNAIEQLVSPESRLAAGIQPTDKTPYQRDPTGKISPLNPNPIQNIELNTQLTGRQAMVAAAVKGFETSQEVAQQATRRQPIWDQMEQAMQGFKPGATAELKLTAGRYIKDLTGQDITGVSDAEVFRMLQQNLAIHAQPKGQGAVSNFEREMFAKALPNMAMSPEALTRAIDISRGLDNFDRKVAQIYRDNAAKNEGVPNPIEINREIAELGDPLGNHRSYVGRLAETKPKAEATATTPLPAPAAPVGPVIAPQPAPPGIPEGTPMPALPQGAPPPAGGLPPGRYKWGPNGPERVQ